MTVPQYSNDWRGGRNRESKLYKVLNYNRTIKNGIRKATSPSTMFAINAGIGLAKQVGRQWLNFHVSDIGRRHGDSNYQAMVNRRMEVVSDVLNVGSGIASGAAAGAIFGPKGAVIGAVVGGISAGIGIGFRQADRHRQFRHEMFIENNSQATMLARANFSVHTGRVR